jgi:hypothetical protein
MDQVTICNMAVGHLGDLGITKRMTAFTRAGCGSSTVLHSALDFYESAKRQMHAMMDWARTRKVKALTVHADAPLLDGKWDYKYVRPPDCLVFRKLIDDTGQTYEWDEVNEERIAGGQTFNDEYIYTNLEDAIGWWTILIEEERYLPGMEELHALILAEKLAMTVTGKTETRLVLASELRGEAARLCKALGATEGYVEGEEGSHELTDKF